MSAYFQLEDALNMKRQLAHSARALLPTSAIIQAGIDQAMRDSARRAMPLSLQVDEALRRTYARLAPMGGLTGQIPVARVIAWDRDTEIRTAAARGDRATCTPGPVRQSPAPTRTPFVPPPPVAAVSASRIAAAAATSRQVEVCLVHQVGNGRHLQLRELHAEVVKMGRILGTGGACLEASADGFYWPNRRYDTPAEPVRYARFDLSGVGNLAARIRELVHYLRDELRVAWMQDSIYIRCGIDTFELDQRIVMD